MVSLVNLTVEGLNGFLVLRLLCHITTACSGLKSDLGKMTPYSPAEQLLQEFLHHGGLRVETNFLPRLESGSVGRREDHVKQRSGQSRGRGQGAGQEQQWPGHQRELT